MAKKEKKTDTPNQGHKHLFGTTEKSDFILNMDFDGAQKMCSRFCMLAIIIATAVLIPSYYTRSVVMYYEDVAPHYLSENFIFYSAAMVMLAGGVGYLVFNVARQKGLVDIKGNKLLALPIVCMVCTLISVAAAISPERKHDAFFGYVSRHDGFLMTFGCFGLFAVAAALSDGERKKKLADFIVGVGLFQSLVGILEVVPATSGLFRNYFDRLFIRRDTVPDTAAGEFFVSTDEDPLNAGIYIHEKAASGFLTSPHALAALLTIAFAIALGGIAFDSSKKRRIFYCIAAPVMAAAACLTKVWAGVLCIAAAALFVTVFAIVKAAKGSKGALAVLIPVACSGIAAGALFGTGASKFMDEAVIFTDSYVVRSTSLDQRYDYIMGLTDKDTDDRNIYNYLFGDGENIIAANPVLGVGPDVCIYCTNDYKLSTDRMYNEYIDFMAQKGILNMALFGAFLLITVIKGFKLLAGFVGGKGDWVSAAALAAVLAFMVQAWFNTSWFSASYLFFIAAGLCWDVSVREESKKPA